MSEALSVPPLLAIFLAQADLIKVLLSPNLTDQQVFDNMTTNFVEGYCKLYSGGCMERHCIGRNTSLLWTNNPNGQDTEEPASALIEGIITRITDSLAYTHENICNEATSDITSMYISRTGAYIITPTHLCIPLTAQISVNMPTKSEFTSNKVQLQ